MTTARIVRYDPEARTYALPPEHAAWLVDDAGPDNLARIMTFLSMLAEVEQGIVRCFREGGWPVVRRLHQVSRSDGRGQQGAC